MSAGYFHFGPRSTLQHKMCWRTALLCLYASIASSSSRRPINRLLAGISLLRSIDYWLVSLFSFRHRPLNVAYPRKKEKMKALLRC